mgnify:CR=1 FL=1
MQGNWWIAKAPAGRRGADIFVITKPEEINRQAPWVLQEYIDRPLLVGGYKFDLRM